METLSKGMSQKVQFIATVIPEPKLLILDEPFTGLDPVSADSIRSAILEMRKRGCTVILSTHDMGVAESLCDSIFMIFRGKKVLDGTLDSIQSSYGSDTIRVEVEGGVLGIGRVARHRTDQRPGPGPGTAHGGQGCDPQQVLHTLVARTRISRFPWSNPRCTIFLSASQARSPRRRPLNRILLIAKRDYLQIVQSKAYLVGLILLPLLSAADSWR